MLERIERDREAGVRQPQARHRENRMVEKPLVSGNGAAALQGSSTRQVGGRCTLTLIAVNPCVESDRGQSIRAPGAVCSPFASD